MMDNEGEWIALLKRAGNLWGSVRGNLWGSAPVKEQKGIDGN